MRGMGWVSLSSRVSGPACRTATAAAAAAASQPPPSPSSLSCPPWAAPSLGERRMYATSAGRPLRPFKLERMPEWYTARHLLSNSDAEPVTVSEVLAASADPATEKAHWLSLDLSYTPESKGRPELIAAILGCYSDGAGASGTSALDATVVAPAEGILLAFQALLEPGDHVIVMHPCYMSLAELPVAMGCNVDLWRPRLSQHGFMFDPEDLEGLLRADTKLVVLNLPHNPTGATLSAADMDRVVATVAARGGRIFTDEMCDRIPSPFLVKAQLCAFFPTCRALDGEANVQRHHGAGIDSGDWPGAAALPSSVELSPTAVALGGMSKVFAMPGIRIGWLVSADAALMARVNELKDYTTICPASPSEKLAICGLTEPARSAIVARSRGLARDGLAAVKGFVADLAPDLTLCEPRGGTMALVRLTAGVSATKYCAYLAEHASVMLVPSLYFDDELGLGDSYVRVGFAREPEGLSAGIAAWRLYHDAAMRHASSG